MGQFGTGDERDVFMIGAVIVFIFFALSIAFLSTVFRLLKRVPEEHRAMRPGLVWLNLIPLFNAGWMVYTTVAVAKSIGRAKGEHDAPTMGIGLTYSITSAVSTVFPPAGIGAFFLWIIYWVIISRQSRTIGMDRSRRMHDRPYPQVPR